jgi:rubrerythrin
MHFRDLNESQILALAVTAEEEDARIYRDFAVSLRKDYAATAAMFDQMAGEEDGHRHRLIDLYRQRFGEHIPLIRRQDVKGFALRRPSWFSGALGPDHARTEAALMEIEARRFYEAAMQRATDAGVRQLLGDLAREEQRHESTAEGITEEQTASGALTHEREAARRLFVLRFIQPGLAGLMDGSVSTLAPLFAAAFATGNTLQTFKVGLAASVGAGISMGFAEAMSDVMTALGGLGHTMPFIISNFHVAMTIALIVVGVELGVIAWIRKRYMDTALLSAVFQVVVGGVLVFLAGWLIGAG